MRCSRCRSPKVWPTLHVASNLLSKRPEEGKQKLDRAIDQAAQAIKEGRDAVQGLRASTIETNDLAAAPSTFTADLAANQAKAEFSRL